MVDVGPKGLRDAAAQRAQRTRGELLRLQEAVSQHLEDSALLRRRQSEAWHDLGAALLPSLDRARLDRLSAELGAPEIAADPIFTTLNEARAELDRTLREIELEQGRRGDRSALIARLHELEAAMAPHAANIETFEREPTWPELFDLAYGTPRYTVPWWMFRHYRHRRQASALVLSLGPRFGAETMTELRERFLHEREARAELAREWEACTVHRAGLDNLERGLEVATASLSALIKRHLSATRRLLCQHLRRSTPDSLIDRFTGTPRAHEAALRIAGLDAQHDHLTELFHVWVERPRTELIALLNQDESDVLELEGDDVERSMPFDEFVDTYRDPQPAWDQRAERFGALRRRLLDFDAYGAHTSGTRWWRLILGDEPPPTAAR